MCIIAELQKTDGTNFRFMQIFTHLKWLFAISCLLCAVSCKPQQAQTTLPAQTGATPEKTPPPVIADKFAYPVGKKVYYDTGEDKKDDWYNAQDFTVNNHLGEDWNINSGGNTDCGEPVFAAANGTIVYAENAGVGWGNVVIIEHYLPDGRKVQTLYGHLQKDFKNRRRS